MAMSNQMYDAAKWFTTVFLPGSATLYVALSSQWGFPEPEKVSFTVMAVVTFLSLLLNLSANKYAKENTADGVMVVDKTDPSKDVYRAELGDELENLASKDRIVLRVQTTENYDSSRADES